MDIIRKDRRIVGDGWEDDWRKKYSIVFPIVLRIHLGGGSK